MTTYVWTCHRAQRDKVNLVGYQLHQAMKSSGLLNPPFLFMYCLKNIKYIYIKTHYITVTLATLADYIIRHQWESRKRHTETPAEVIGCNSAWCREHSLWGSSKSLHVFNSVFSPKTGVWSVRTHDEIKARETPKMSYVCATTIKTAQKENVFPFCCVPVFPLHGHIDSKSINCSVSFPALWSYKNKH